MNIFGIQTISYLRANTSHVLKRLQEKRDPVVITVNGKVQAIVEDVLSYQQRQEQLAMLRILAQGRKQVSDGKLTDHDDFFAQLGTEDIPSIK
ncbi:MULTISPECIES: type II toxin-antitoxin system Phd/YefM family antitoxin [unclassified Janthinobacterium]|uniref:type II toxin-antitoxin system Phd/YefM family antitoxin n=1 Tax=unclassified Janthinobacterium TaxID=2610881 RepID=UPI00161F886A|nr:MULTISPECIES: type II toxin-antitoxin system Phd/YefM family antitoxin [unclassified Janthinobacterium]MBB5368143.1 prevent-host-death family protein [Janthinobacterium sp. K2C7]MBB5379379.1 prevent-host-death family protein [Janthinobacterium sp. K2Li3]MBB5386525.1 prevent-host-death family protein [Janthinobacterium sp. K2E3]